MSNSNKSNLPEDHDVKEFDSTIATDHVAPVGQDPIERLKQLRSLGEENLPGDAQRDELAQLEEEFGEQLDKLQASGEEPLASEVNPEGSSVRDTENE